MAVDARRTTCCGFVDNVPHAFPALAGDKPLRRNAKIFIEEMEGDLDGFIRAEMVKRKVHLEIVLTTESADCIVTGNLLERKAQLA